MTTTPEIARAANALTPDLLALAKRLQDAADDLRWLAICRPVDESVARELAEQEKPIVYSCGCFAGCANPGSPACQNLPAAPSPDEAGSVEDVPVGSDEWLARCLEMERFHIAALRVRSLSKEVAILTARAEKAEKERDEARYQIGCAYQVIGCLAEYGGIYDHPEVVRAMDHFANSDGPWPNDILPFSISGPSISALAAKRLEVIEAAHSVLSNDPRMRDDTLNKAQVILRCGLTSAIEGEKMDDNSKIAALSGEAALGARNAPATLREALAPTEAAPGVVERLRQCPQTYLRGDNEVPTLEAEAAALIDSQHSTIEELRKALEESVSLMGATLDADFGFWSAPQNEKVRGPIYAAWRHLNRALEILEKKANRRALPNSESGK